MAIKDHLADIDFRTREVRQADYKDEFKRWYDELCNRLSTGYDDVVYAQLTVLTAVLWYLLPKNEYNKLRKIKQKPKSSQPKLNL